MIAHLAGTLANKTQTQAVIDVGGVGYLITATSRTLDAIGEIGGSVKLLTEMVVREDSMTLFGFGSTHEKDVFLLLQTVQGVGAKAAIAILSALGPAEVEEAIMAGDKAMITRADGIGPKIATRIVNELAEKLGKLKSASLAPAMGSGGGLSGGLSDQADLAANVALSDALSALVNLGYARAEAWQVLREISATDSGADSASLISAALKELGIKGGRL
ncbi:MAG: Holliday junction branch migration protein RuvA [Candidatus Puniceispirillaceae bacterium]